MWRRNRLESARSNGQPIIGDDGELLRADPKVDPAHYRDFEYTTYSPLPDPQLEKLRKSERQSLYAFILLFICPIVFASCLLMSIFHN